MTGFRGARGSSGPLWNLLRERPPASHPPLEGSAPSDCPDFAAFLVEQGIDSISLSPGVVVPTTPEILEVEQKTDRPRGRV
jgi:hypothetical protein